MRYILDTSYFFDDYPFSGEFFTTLEVITELRDITAKMRYEVLQGRGLVVSSPDAAALAAARETAERSGDARVLSETDISVIALGIFLEGTVVSDDFAVQNVCRHRKIPIQNMVQKIAKRRVWKCICCGCGTEISEGKPECQICGSPPVKRGTEKKKTRRTTHK